MTDPGKTQNNSAFLPTIIFAYGTLMTGYGNNRLLLGSRSLGRARTRHPAFAMFHNHVPFVRLAQQAEAGSYVSGELFAVADEATLASLDSLEGHPDWCTPFAC
jgi:gamma-glutamylcyclotransferase (GGCT)/AIG2-like uncharacterized protein YtfP